MLVKNKGTAQRVRNIGNVTSAVSSVMRVAVLSARTAAARPGAPAKRRQLQTI